MAAPASQVDSQDPGGPTSVRHTAMRSQKDAPKEEMPCFIDKLPLELLCQVVGHLDPENQLLAALVCKEWAGAVAKEIQLSTGFSQVNPCQAVEYAQPIAPGTAWIQPSAEELTEYEEVLTKASNPNNPEYDT